LIRDGGPYLSAPFGTISWPSITIGTHVFSAEIDGAWWLVRFHESVPTTVGTTVRAGDQELVMAASPDGRWEVLRVPSTVDRVEVVEPWGREVFGRPSSG
jgi:hypothetical protein